MLSNQEQMDLLKQAVRQDYQGSIADLMEGIQPEQQQNVQVAETPEQQQQGMSGMAPEQMPDAMVFPQSQGDFNTMNMQAPVNVDKYGPEGELVRSYESVPPGVGNLPMGEDIGTVIETPAEYQTKGIKDEQGLEELPILTRGLVEGVSEQVPINVNVHPDFRGVNISQIPIGFGGKNISLGGRFPMQNQPGSIQGAVSIPINKKEGGFFPETEKKSRKTGGFFNMK